MKYAIYNNSRRLAVQDVLVCEVNEMLTAVIIVEALCNVTDVKGARYTVTETANPDVVIYDTVPKRLDKVNQV